MNKLKFELGRCQKIFELNILQSEHVLCQSALIEILIRLNYILQSLNKVGNRISWKDDVEVEGGDITDLVNNMRNAACHSESYLNKIGNATIIFNKLVGYVPNAIKIGDITIGSNYADDIAFNYGSYVIYLKRHIARLLDELTKILNTQATEVR